MFIILPFLLEHHDKLNDMIQQLTLSLAGVKHEQEYMQVRDRVHRSSTALSISQVIFLGGGGELMVLYTVDSL